MKENNWVEITDEDYKIGGRESDSGWFSTRKWYVHLIMFVNTETGEIKSYKRNIVERIGKDNILKKLNA